jgi:hypothetical protein
VSFLQKAQAAADPLLLKRKLLSGKIIPTSLPVLVLCSVQVGVDHLSNYIVAGLLNSITVSVHSYFADETENEK